jgi:hypothetical protein
MLGRFLSPDPIGIAGGINLYGYVGNDPLDSVDPRGLSPGNFAGELYAPVGVLAVYDGGFAIGNLGAADPCKPRDFGGPCSPKVPSATPLPIPSPTPGLEVASIPTPSEIEAQLLEKERQMRLRMMIERLMQQELRQPRPTPTLTPRDLEPASPYGPEGLPSSW